MKYLDWLIILCAVITGVTLFFNLSVIGLKIILAIWLFNVIIARFQIMSKG